MSQSPDFGNNVIVHEGAIIHENCIIGDFTIVYSGVIIEENVTIGSGTILGKKAETGKNQTSLLEQGTKTIIKKNTKIGDHVIVYSGCTIGENNYLADKSFLRENVQLSDNVVIGTAVTVSFNAHIGPFTKVMTSTNIGGNMKIGSHCFIGAHVCSVNDNYPKLKTKRENQLSAVIEDNVVIGSNTTILPHIIIKKNITVGASSNITKSLLEEGGTYLGNPAKKIK